MHGENKQVPAEEIDDGPFRFVANMIKRHGEEMGKELAELEEAVAFHGRKLDELTRARDTLIEALNGTEKVRANMMNFDNTGSEPDEAPARKF